MKINKVLIVTIVLNFVFGMGSFVHANMPAVHVESLEKKSVQERQKVIGTLRATSKSDVAAREEGAILTVDINEGDLVKKGDRLVTLDQRRLEAQLKQAKASLATARALMVQREAENKRADVDFEMKEDLYKEKAVSLKAYLDSEREKKVSVARLQSSKESVAEMESRIELLKVRLEDMTIEAPFDGWVVTRHVEPGEWLTPGVAVATIVSSGKIEAWINVPERLSSKVLKNQKASIDVRIPAINKTIQTNDFNMVREVDARSRTFQIVAVLDNKKGLLTPGMSVEAWVPKGKQEKQLVVSADAVVRNSFGAFVYKADPSDDGHTAQQIQIQELFRMNQSIVIQSASLKEGDLIIVEGNERVFPNTPIQVSFKEGEKVSK